MAADFPAAHSHDVLWFAIDQAGHVGMFWSGSMGHSPEEAENAEDLGVELRSQIRLEAIDRSPRTTDQEQAVRLGFFYYEYDPAPYPLYGELTSVSLYSRVRVPEKPLHVDQLPPELRRRFKRIRFEGVDFTRSKWLQPLEQYPCEYRYRDERVAYLCGDGKTVRPIPGRERDFAEFCREFREQSPEQAAGLIFQGAKEAENRPTDEEKDHGK